MKGDKYHHKDGSVLDYYDYYKVLHRVDGPAIELHSGSKEWWIDGEKHREDGPAIEWGNGSKEWWIDGKLHRLDGPACECANGYKSWYVNGKRHRIDGPAIELSNGGKEWYVNGIFLSEKDFNNHPKVLKHKYEQQFYKELEERL